MPDSDSKSVKAPSPIWVLMGLIALELLFVLPSQGLPMGDRHAVGAGVREWFAQAWLSLEVCALVLFLVWRRHRVGRLMSMALTGLLLFGVFVEVYDVFILRAFSRPSILYTDRLLLWDGVNLAFDLVPGGIVGTMVLTGALIGLSSFVVRQLVNVIDAGTQALDLSRGWVMLVALALLGVMLERGPEKRDALVQSPYARLADNLSRSVDMGREMALLAAEPLSLSPEQRLSGEALAQTPDIYVLVIESYGSALLDHDSLQREHAAQMNQVEGRLRDAGYRLLSNQSESPVVGGLSWQATSTLLSGIRISNQHIYSKLSESGAYGLPEFLNSKGYTTWTVQPGFRTRPGRPVSNPWGYNQTLYFEDLAYEGKRWGWGVVPDQYALGLAHKAIALSTERPHFMMFTGVSTHVPWDQVPPFRDDWQSFGRPDDGAAPDSLLGQLRDKWKNRGVSCVSTECYQRAMKIEWEVLVDFMERVQSPEVLFVILGDHQPPVISVENANVPIHLIGRGLSGLDGLNAIGFQEGLLPDGSHPIRHAGLFSLMAGILAGDHDPRAEGALYRAQGASASGLLER